ncbi:MAG TPA: TonB-dependent receptor [Acidobacteriaceae bacterium]|nr:TonB-dependent receptor [Acidobacteriaceae bacterium]
MIRQFRSKAALPSVHVLFTALTPMLVGLLFFAGTVNPACAQTTQGFTGTVTDPSGAVVANALVTLHSENTGLDKKTATTSAGLYTIPFLPPGVYDVQVEAPGFKKLNKTSITLQVDQTATVNFQLAVGTVDMTVTVNSSATVLDYSKADRGMVLDTQSIQELPTFDANTFNLALLAPGVMTTTAGGPGNQSAQSYSIHNAGVEFNIDGVTNQGETGPEHYIFPPPVAAVQEFKITTNPYDASVGRAPGGQIDMTLKSGGKNLHGSAYENLQRAFLNANSSTSDANISKNRAAGLPTSAFNKGAFTQNQWGFELDGPVIAPKLWPRQRQTFFTVLFEDIGNHGIGTSTTSVPTPEMLTGDFSALLGATVPGVSGSYNGAIYDPTTEAACTANNTDNGTFANGHPHVCRYQFGYGAGSTPGPQGNPIRIGTPNVIPANRLSPVALAILSWYPAPNLAPTPTTANPFANNYVGHPAANSDNKSYLVKITQTLGARDTFEVTGKVWKYFGQANNAFPRYNVNAAHPGLNQAVTIAHYNGTDYRYPSLSVSETHTFSPSIVNTARALISSVLESDSTGPSSGFDPANLGFTSPFAQVSSNYFKRFPNTAISNYNGLGSQAGLFRGDDELQLIDIANWTHGKHTMHFGGEGRWTQYSQKSSNGNGVNLSINNGWSQQWDTTVTGGSSSIHSSTGYANNYSGNSIASMLLGTWESGNATAAAGNYFSSRYAALYFQDDWKLRPDLTVNLGVRWEYPGHGLTDRFNRLTSLFDLTDVNPINSMINPSTLPISGVLLGGPTWAGVGGNPRFEYYPVYYDFGPRAGFAYTINQKTVMRGGVGLFFNDQAAGNQNQPAQLGYSTSTTYSGSSPLNLGSSTGLQPLGNMANPFPAFQQPTGNCGGDATACLATNAGQGLSYENRNFRPAELLSFSFGFERQLTRNDILDVSYVGNRMYNNTTSDNINRISSAAQAACDPLRGGDGRNCTQNYGTTPAAGTSVGFIPNPFYHLAPFAASGAYYSNTTIQKINFTRPYPIFGDITENRLNGGKNWYNAFEVVYDHRTAYGLTLHLGYGYSKAMSSGGYADVINRVPSRTISGTDVPHRLTTSVVYQLPIARGKGFFPNLPRALDYVVGGWQATGIYLLQSGIPQNMNGWIIDQKANGGFLLPHKRFWGGNSNPWYPGLTSVASNSYIQRIKPCVATTDPNTGALVWIGQSQTLANSGLCSTPNFIKVGTYGVAPNIVYSGIREGIRNNLDMNIAKNFAIHERTQFQLRIDAFNALNHMQFYANGFDTSTTDGFFGIYQLGTSGNGSASSRQIQIEGRLSF